jgi:NADP-dependent 3-hydroxy acid dehydrogenase YdfG
MARPIAGSIVVITGASSDMGCVMALACTGDWKDKA